jgi:hypothetical protein
MKMIYIIILLALSAVAVADPTKNTRCISPNECFCVSTSFEPLITEKVQLFRTRLREAQAHGRYTLYISVPFSTKGGGYRGINIGVAGKVAAALTTSYGSDRLFVLNPSTDDATLSLPNTQPTQADYLYMWGQVLAGDDGLAPNLDTVYMVGPSDFAAAMGIPNIDKIKALEEEFDQRLKEDKQFAQAVAAQKVGKREFVAYYAFRASTAFSAGAHDEWNVISSINARRRAADPVYGVGRQLAVWFDGHQVVPEDIEGHVSAGSEGSCPVTLPHTTGKP